MANDSSIIDIDSLALESVTGGMIPLPNGGGYGGSAPLQPPPKPPAGGSLTAPGIHLSCPAGTAPYLETVSGTATGSLGPIHVGHQVTVRAYGCAKVK